MRRLSAVVLGCLLTTGCARMVEIRTVPVEHPPVDAPVQSLVYAADGSLIATLRLAHRTPVVRDDLPAVVVAALVAAEDRAFFDHRGVDPRALLRAAVANGRAHDIVQGGSTLTQQLVKNRYFPEAERTLQRKVDEARLALDLERRMSKDEILVDYLNTVYFGAGAYGIEAAAQTYFGVPTTQLQLVQAALLVGLLRAPESANPYRAPQRASAERARVLQAMVADGWITAAAARRAADAPLGVLPAPAPATTRYPYFVEAVKRALLADARFGPDEAARVRLLFGAGLRVHTTIDPRLQHIAETAARQALPRRDDPEIAVAVVRPADGHVVALVSGRDFGTSQWDLATQARRQPGSTYKTFALVAALRAGWRLDDRVESGPAAFGRGPAAWQVRSPALGPLSLTEALARSSNGAFARLGMQVGPDRIAGTAATLGVRSPLEENPASILGGLSQGVTPLDMASAYGTLANGGLHVAPVVVNRVTDAAGRTVWEADRQPRAAVDGETAWLATQALRAVVETGTGQAATIGRPAAGKTGTSQHNRDAWFVGFTPELSAAVWVGYPDGERTLGSVPGRGRVDGGSIPAAVWARVLSEALAGTAVREFPFPEHAAVTVDIDPTSGKLATRWCPQRVPGTGLRGELPAAFCPLHLPPPPPPPPAASPVAVPPTAGAPTAAPGPSAAPDGAPPAPPPPQPPASPPAAAPPPAAPSPAAQPSASPGPPPSPSPTAQG